MKNRAYIGNLMVDSHGAYIVWGSVRGLVSEHRTQGCAENSLGRDRRGCKSQGGYSDSMIYKWDGGVWNEI